MILTFDNGTCEPNTWGGTFEHHLDMDTDGDGIPDLTREMVLADGIRSGITQYSSGQVSEGRTFLEDLRIFAEGSGPNYQESYTHPGKYVHQFGDGAPCEWDLIIDSAGLANIEEAIDAAIMAAEEAIAAAATTTTTIGAATTGATTTTLVAAADVDSDPLPDAAEVEAGTDPADEGGGGGLFVVLILVGSPSPHWPTGRADVLHASSVDLAVLAGVCGVAAGQGRLRQGDEGSQGKAQEGQRGPRCPQGRREEMKEHCKACPPACRPPSSVSSGGRTVTSEDVWIQNQWAADAWSNFNPGQKAPRRLWRTSGGSPPMRPSGPRRRLS